MFPQALNSSIVGVIHDPSGSSVRDAKVTVTDVDKNIARSTSSGPNGEYQVAQLAAGHYRVSAERQGFQTSTTEPQNLNLNQNIKLDLTLQVGEFTQTVEVNTQASGVETINATLGKSVTSRPLVDLPLNGRNTLDLALLQPGVTPSNDSSSYSQTTGGNTSTGGGFNISGSRNDSITYLLDGAINNSFLYNDIVYNPNPDTIQEFRILTSNYNAEYGRNAGGVVSFITKSGTNSIHGSVFDFLRNNDLNGNSFFSNAQGQPRDILKRNQYGFAVGGPVVLPKIINGRDKLFFFGSYQGQRQVQTFRTGQITTFTPAELGGDFSKSNAAGNGPLPSLVQFLRDHPAYQPNPTLADQGIIDPTRIDSAARAYINHGLIPTSATGFLFPYANGSNNSDEATGKVDYVPTSSERLAVTLGGARNPTVVPFDGANIVGYPSLNNIRRYFVNVSLTSVLSPSFLNELRISAQRQNRLRSAPGATAPLASDLGVDITPDNPTGPPQVSFSSGLNLGFSGYGPSFVVNNTFQYSDTVTWTRGRHTLKGGFSFSPFQDNTVFGSFVNGQYSFNGANSTGRTGNDRANFLLGLPDTFFQYPEAPSNIRTASYAAFFQDEWRVTPRFVVTLGLRYDYDTPRRDTQGRSYSLVYGRQSQVFPGAPPGLLFPGDPGAPIGANFPDRNNWSPRFGFAFDPGGDGRTSIRGGFGVFYDVLKGEDIYQLNGVAPFAASAYLAFNPPAAGAPASLSAFAQPYQAANVPNPFPTRPPPKNLDFYQAYGPFYGPSVDPRERTPYVYQYNLSVQRQLGKDFIAELDYVGNGARKLTALVDPNPFVPNTGVRLLNTQPGVHINTDGQPDSWALPTQFINGANANYNSMQAGLQKRYGSVSFQLSYTWSHTIDDASGFEQPNSRVPYYNHHAFHASSDQDIRHYVALSGLWDLPFDKWFGRNRLTQGWSLNPIYTFRSGQALDISAGLPAVPSDPGPSGAGDPGLARPNLVAPVAYFDPRQAGGAYFDPASFSIANLTGYGTLGRNSLRGPSRTNLDLRVSKSTFLYAERVRLDAIGEFFNIFNHAQFRNPDLNFNSGTFGIISQTYDPRIVQLALKLYF